MINPAAQILLNNYVNESLDIKDLALNIVYLTEKSGDSILYLMMKKDSLNFSGFPVGIDIYLKDISGPAYSYEIKKPNYKGNLEEIRGNHIITEIINKLKADLFILNSELQVITSYYIWRGLCDDESYDSKKEKKILSNTILKSKNNNCKNRI